MTTRKISRLSEECASGVVVDQLAILTCTARAHLMDDTSAPRDALSVLWLSTAYVFDGPSPTKVNVDRFNLPPI